MASSPTMDRREPPASLSRSCTPFSSPGSGNGILPPFFSVEELEGPFFLRKDESVAPTRS